MNIKKYFLPTTYKDSRNNMIYYDHFTNIAYKIPKDVTSMFKAFLGRGLYTLAIFLYMNVNNYDQLLTIIITLGFFLLSNFYFYSRLLPKYNPVNNFNLEKATKDLKSESKNIRLFLMLLYAISIGLIIYLAYTSNDSFFTLITIVYVLYALFKIIQSIIILS